MTSKKDQLRHPIQEIKHSFIIFDLKTVPIDNLCSNYKSPVVEGEGDTVICKTCLFITTLE